MHNIRFLLPVLILLWKQGFNSLVGSKPATIKQTILLHPQHENQHQKWPKKVHIEIQKQLDTLYSSSANNEQV